MKKITIPVEYGYPTVTVVINHHQYVLKTGVEIDVEDCVAAMFEDNESNELEPAPKPDSPGGSGGGGADLLDENGIIKQEYFPEGFPYGSLQKVTVMPETTLYRDASSGRFYIPGGMELYAGMECVIRFTVPGMDYEMEYKSVCRELPANQLGGKWGLGNLSIMGMGEDTGEPFAIGALPMEMVQAAGMGGMMVSTLSLESVTVTITALPANFSFIDPGYVENALILVKVVGDINSGDFTSSHTPQEMDALLRNGKILMLEHRDGADFYDRNVYTLYNWEPGIDARFQSTRLTSGSIYVRDISIYPKENKWDFFEVRATAVTVQ